MTRLRPLTVFIAHPSELLTDHLPHGDGLVSFAFLSRLAARGHEVHVAAQRVDIRRPLPPSLHVYVLMPRSDTSLFDRLAFMVRMRALFHRLSRRRAFDVVHQMNPVFTGLSLALIGARPPLVLGTFVPRWQAGADGAVDRPPAVGWRVRVKQRVLQVLARVQQSRAAALLIASPAALSRIAAPPAYRPPVFEVPHGIDLQGFQPRVTPPASPSVLFLANVIRRKGIFTLLEAFDLVAQRASGGRAGDRRRRRRRLGGGGDGAGAARPPHHAPRPRRTRGGAATDA